MFFFHFDPGFYLFFIFIIFFFFFFFWGGGVENHNAQPLKTLIKRHIYLDLHGLPTSPKKGHSAPKL